MLVDFLLAIAHHLLIFALLGVLVVEMMILRPEMSPAAVLRVGRIDAIYGALAGLILIVGFGRVFFGIKGAAFYLGNPVFWAKIAAFAAVGLLSIGWRRQAARNPGFVPSADEVQNVKRLMHMEGFAFILIPILAAMMARGYGN